MVVRRQMMSFYERFKPPSRPLWRVMFFRRFSLISRYAERGERYKFVSDGFP